MLNTDDRGPCLKSYYWPVTTLKKLYILPRQPLIKSKTKNRSHTEISLTCGFLFSDLTAMQSDWANISD